MNVRVDASLQNFPKHLDGVSVDSVHKQTLVVIVTGVNLHDENIYRLHQVHQKYIQNLAAVEVVLVEDSIEESIPTLGINLLPIHCLVVKEALNR